MVRVRVPGTNRQAAAVHLHTACRQETHRGLRHAAAFDEEYQDERRHEHVETDSRRRPSTTAANTAAARHQQRSGRLFTVHVNDRQPQQPADPSFASPVAGVSMLADSLLCV